ncbi:MAG: 2-amino-4-hydroxy-6-hydroxymethyldihydropteridine diphosphokinase [Victivallales bacterium]|nr:2-amino-4-hydroxy-6-hydroxymethyldihydropteridine diphosphokinase [Victivallales bacterium]
MQVAIALGGNIGDTEGLFRRAVQMLGEGGLQGVRVSRTIVSTPVDCVPGTPEFHNAALTGAWQGTALELLALTQRIERSLGRPAVHSSRESRTMDLDILLFGEESLALPELVIPHPRMIQRRFVLEPLAEIAPDWHVPPEGTTVAELLRKLLLARPGDKEMV